MQNIFLKSKLILLLYGCCSTKINKSGCGENQEFKRIFFLNIEYIEKNITHPQNESFQKSLNLLAKYVQIEHLLWEGVPLSTNAICVPLHLPGPL